MRSDPFAKQILWTIADAQTALWAIYERVDFVFRKEKGEQSRSQVQDNLKIRFEAIIILIKINNIDYMINSVDIYMW